MRLRWLVLVLVSFACSTPTKTPTPTTNTTDPASSQGQHNQGSQTMTPPDAPHPGGTGVDKDGVLLRSKPDPSVPAPDPAMVADDDANLLFFAGSMVGDVAVQRKVWVHLGLADAGGNPTPKMTEFIRANQEWVKTKGTLIATVATAAKAKAYLDAHLQ
jgi:hypothetical protein